MELDQLTLEELDKGAKIINVLGYFDSVEDIGVCIRVLEATLYTYRRTLRDMQGDHV